MTALSPRKFSSVPNEDLMTLINVCRDTGAECDNPHYGIRLIGLANEMLDELKGRPNA